jgi:hypothetical protein
VKFGDEDGANGRAARLDYWLELAMQTLNLNLTPVSAHLRMFAVPCSALCLGLALWFSGTVAPAQDNNVTVPKSRLEELERKEKELDRLRGDLDKTKHENIQLKKENEKAVARPALTPRSEPAQNYVGPAMSALPALRSYDVVESMDLAYYFQQDRSAAEERFRKQKITVRGEIVGFEKPLWKRNYRILLKTPGREMRVICDFLPPDKSSAVFTTDHGDQLVATMGNTRVPIATVGQNVLVKGECRGLSDSVVLVLGWELQPVR